jgi:hypothetical protein
MRGRSRVRRLRIVVVVVMVVVVSVGVIVVRRRVAVFCRCARVAHLDAGGSWSIGVVNFAWSDYYFAARHFDF